MVRRKSRPLEGDFLHPQISPLRPGDLHINDHSRQEFWNLYPD
jgi:hypothetical protein